MRKNLKEARQKAGMTQQQLANKLKLNLRHYQKIEYGEIGGDRKSTRLSSSHE